MNKRPTRSLLVLISLIAVAYAAGGTPPAVGAVGNGAATDATTAAAANATVQPNPQNSLDCNGYSKMYPPVRPGMRALCADPKAIGTGSYGGYTHATAPGRFYDNGHYVGHDEPSVKFESSAAGSGNNMTYFLQLPQDPAGAPTTSPTGTTTADQAELTPAFWFGLPLCDNKSFPSASGVAGDGVGGFHDCTPKSDSNAPNPSNQSTTGGGSAVLELQFYPPGYGPYFDGVSCDPTKYCAALTIDSLEAVCGGQPHCTSNANCAEPVNFAFLTLDGTPTGPPSPQLSSYETLSPNGNTLMMGQSDALRVSILDTAHGVETKVDDLTSGRSGFMIASASNGFMQTDPGSCNGNPYDFHAEYNTAAQNNLVPWAALEFGVLISNETGHFEPCSSLSNNLPFTANFSPSGDTFSDNSLAQTCHGAFEAQTSGSTTGEFCNTVQQTCAGNTEGNFACSGGTSHCEASDYACMAAGGRTVTVNGVNQTWSWPVSGCLANQFQNGDLDFDGSSYIADWADGASTHPTAAKFLGPFDGSGADYPTMQFETNAPGSEENCDFSTGAGCSVPPPGATNPFYPYWSIENVAGFPGAPPSTACIWNFGNDGNTPIGDFSKDAQYGGISSFFPGTLISPPASNPATSAAGCLSSETASNVTPPLPTVTGVSPASGYPTQPHALTVTGTNFSGTFNATPFTAHSVQIGATQLTATCGAAPCFTVNSASSITVQLPPFPVGRYDITVTNPGGTSVTGPNDVYVSKVFNQAYTLDAFGGLHSVPSSPGGSFPQMWPGWKIARSVALLPGGASGYTLDGWGGIHPFGGAPAVAGGAYWAGWDIARGIVLLSTGSGGYVLDGWGGIHPFGNAPRITNGPYFPGFDIARGIVLSSDSGGYVLDGWGGIHPFGNAPAMPNGPYFPGFDIARAMVLNGSGGAYVLDGWGGVHPAGTAGSAPDSAYWGGWDIARSLTMAPGFNNQGWVLDGWGGIHPFGSAPGVNTGFYSPGQDINRVLSAV